MIAQRLSLIHSLPDGVYESYQQITPELLQSRGIRLLLSDLDYTLAPKSVSRPDQAVRDWLSRLQAAGIRVMILSNNRSPRRVEQFCRDLGTVSYTHLRFSQSSRRWRMGASSAWRTLFRNFLTFTSPRPPR